MWIDSSGATANVLQGNYIGTDSTATRAIGNSGDGVCSPEGPGNTDWRYRSGRRRTRSLTTALNGVEISGGTGDSDRGQFDLRERRSRYRADVGRKRQRACTHGPLSTVKGSIDDDLWNGRNRSQSRGVRQPELQRPRRRGVPRLNRLLERKLDADSACRRDRERHHRHRNQPAERQHLRVLELPGGPAPTACASPP